MTATGRRLRYTATAAIFISAFSSSAAFAAITVTTAKIEAGKLRVTGTSPTGTSVKLDNTFSATISGGAFSFNISYLPPDCIAQLTLVGAVAPAVQAVIAECGPRGLNPLGGWDSGTTYVENDLVGSEGSSWRAKSNSVGGPNLNKLPSANPTFWQKFASRGAPGPHGTTGPVGPTGPQGATGPKGDTGAQGLQGIQGPQGIQGQTGAAGAAGAAGAQGEKGYKGDPGAQGVAGPAGPTLQKRTTFRFIEIPPQPTAYQIAAANAQWAGYQNPNAELASLTFIPPADGTAILRSRGYCNMTGGASQNQINIAAGTDVATAFDNSDFENWGVLSLPPGAVHSTQHQLMFASEKEMPVSAGIETTVFLAGRHEFGTLYADCGGSFQVEVYTGTLPEPVD